MKYLLQLLLLGWSVHAVQSQSLPAGYHCDPATCAPPSCTCASYSAPVLNPPQFVVITFDDSMESNTIIPAWNLLLGRFNPNSCPAQATYFVSAMYTDPILAEQWYARGNEIAIHTVDHDAGNELPYFTTETEGARYFVHRYAGIPRGKITGFRHPFLKYNSASFDTLHKMGYTYDSSISENSATGMWPYTLDHGSVNDCGPSASSGISICKAGSYPGLWEVPINTIFDSNGIAYNFDPYNYPSVDNPFPSSTVTSMYTQTFDKHYGGSRAPFGFYIHPLWLSTGISGIPDGSKKWLAVKNALDYMMSKPNVWIVTNAQLIEYMKNPVPANQLASQPYMQCNGPYPSADICNGLNPDLAKTCDTPTSSYHSCYGCAKKDLTIQPNTFNPPPPVSGTPVPDNCDSKWWDPATGKCTCPDVSCQWADNSRPIQLSGINPNFSSTNTVPAPLASAPSPTNTPWWSAFVGRQATSSYQSPTNMTGQSGTNTTTQRPGDGGSMKSGATGKAATQLSATATLFMALSSLVILLIL